jgi:hypothetical protein
MRKRKSTRETKNMIQTALWLPRDMHEVLKKAGGERGLGEEIRRKLQFALEAADAAAMPGEHTTGELLDQIKDIARDLSSDEPWYANRFTFDVFKAAIEALLLDLQPRAEARPETKAHLQAVYRAEKPEDIGLLMARAAIIAYARERQGEAFLKAMNK